MAKKPDPLAGFDVDAAMKSEGISLDGFDVNKAMADEGLRTQEGPWKTGYVKPDGGPHVPEQSSLPENQPDEPTFWEKLKGGAENALHASADGIDRGSDVVGAFMSGVNNKASMGVIPMLQRGMKKGLGAVGVDIGDATGAEMAARHPVANSLGEGTGLGISAVAGPDALIAKGVGNVAAKASSYVPSVVKNVTGAKVLGHMASGGATAALSEAARAPIEEGIPWSEIPTRAADAGETGGAFSGLMSIMSGGGRRTADAIRNSNTTTGEDIRLLERRGASPSPMPGRPVKNAPSEQLGVAPTPHGRGQLGERGASRLADELAVQDRQLSQRLNSDELPRAMKSQGGRTVSTESEIADIDARLANPSIDLIPGMRGQLESARKVLANELESNVDIYSSRVPDEMSAGPKPEVQSFQPPMTDLNRRINPTTGEQSIDPRIRRPRLESREIEPGRALSVDSAEPISIGLDDIRARSGDGPNHVMTVQKMNETRKDLDAAGGSFAAERKLSKKDLAVSDVANSLRSKVRQEAPAVGLANRRYEAGKRKLETTEARMKTPDSESLGMQIAGQGEEGAKSAGARSTRLDTLRENFPTSERLTRRDVDQIFDDPRALLAEERMGLKKLPRIGGGDDMWNLREPIAGRLVYPGALEAEMAASAAGRRLPAPMSSLFAKIREAARLEQERRQKEELGL